MRRPQVLYDGLWRCLCPSVDKASLSRALRAPASTLSRSNGRPTQCQARPQRFIRRAPACRQDRTYGGLAADGASGASSSYREPRVSKDDYDFLTAPQPLTMLDFQSVPTDELIIALRKLQNSRAAGIDVDRTDIHKRIITIVGELLVYRQVPLSTFIYECMMYAMIDPRGSVAGVKLLLKDMMREDVALSPALCQSALAALCIHPDYVVRQHVLDLMRDRWFAIDQSSQQYNVLGMLREGQYELAYERFSRMQKGGAPIDLWVYDIFVMVFSHQGFLDEMLQIFIERKQVESDDPAYLGLAYRVLDVCSSAYHYHGTAFAWTSTVRNDLIKPSDGMLENILATASREGDFELASQVLSMMSNRGRVHEEHYDALVEAFAAGGNLDGAMRMVRIMARTCDQIGRSHTWPIYALLTTQQHLLDEAGSSLRSMAEDGHVPGALVSAVMEATAQVKGTESAMDLYEDMEKLSGQPHVSVQTLQALIINSRDEKVKHRLIRKLHKKLDSGADISRLTRQPAAAHMLISTLLDTAGYRLGMRVARAYVDKYGSSHENMPWLKTLTQKAIELEDETIWHIMDKLREVRHTEATDTMSRTIRQAHMVAKREQLLKHPTASAAV